MRDGQLTAACASMHHSSMDMESVRARVVDAYQQGPDAVAALVVALLSELAAQLETVSARVAALEEENAALRAKLGTNSGTPTSTFQVKRNPFTAPFLMCVSSWMNEPAR